MTALAIAASCLLLLLLALQGALAAGFMRRLRCRPAPDVPEAQPIAWVHKDCLADYARPFEIGDLPETDLAALREYARSVDAGWAKG